MEEVEVELSLSGVERTYGEVRRLYHDEA